MQGSLALQLQIRQAVAKRVIFEHWSEAYFWVREHRSAENYPLQTGMAKNATVVLALMQAKALLIYLKAWGHEQNATSPSHIGSTIPTRFEMTKDKFRT